MTRMECQFYEARLRGKHVLQLICYGCQLSLQTYRSEGPNSSFNVSQCAFGPFERMFSAKLHDFEEQMQLHQNEITDSQLSKFGQSILCTDSFKFERKSCADQSELQINSKTPNVSWRNRVDWKGTRHELNKSKTKIDQISEQVRARVAGCTRICPKSTCRRQ